TAQKHSERLQKLLLDELNHRVKNTLATVQAIASQSLIHAKNPDAFVESFSGRIQAMARAHTQLFNAEFEGVEVAQLIREQVAFGAGMDQRISYNGPEVLLAGTSAIHLALVLHELATNARKHGALSVPKGHLSVSWEVVSSGGRDLHLAWKETGGPK